MKIKKFKPIIKIGDYVTDKYDMATGCIYEVTETKEVPKVHEPSGKETLVLYYHLVSLDKYLNSWAHHTEYLTVLTDDEKEYAQKNGITSKEYKQWIKDQSKYTL